MDKQYQERIVINPRIMAGKPTIQGTRIPVDLLVRLVAQGLSFEEILADYPRLQIEDIQASLFYAAATVAGEEIFLLSEPELA